MPGFVIGSSCVQEALQIAWVQGEAQVSGSSQLVLGHLELGIVLPPKRYCNVFVRHLPSASLPALGAFAYWGVVNTIVLCCVLPGLAGEVARVGLASPFPAGLVFGPGRCRLLGLFTQPWGKLGRSAWGKGKRARKPFCSPAMGSKLGVETLKYAFPHGTWKSRWPGLSQEFCIHSSRVQAPQYAARSGTSGLSCGS